MRKIEDESVKTTKKARRKQQRRKVANKKSITPKNIPQNTQPPIGATLPETFDSDDDIKPFDELVEV